MVCLDRQKSGRTFLGRAVAFSNGDSRRLFGQDPDASNRCFWFCIFHLACSFCKMDTMKIRRLQITMEPSCPITVAGASGYKTLCVEVRTECGRIFSTTDILDEDDFRDVFGIMMGEAERRIRKMAEEKNTPADEN